MKSLLTRKDKGKASFSPHRLYFQGSFLDHFRLQKPEESKSSQYCDAIVNHVDSTSVFTSVLTLYEKISTQQSGELDNS